jgi:hypothetical protein
MSNLVRYEEGEIVWFIREGVPARIVGMKRASDGSAVTVELVYFTNRRGTRETVDANEVTLQFP